MMKSRWRHNCPTVFDALHLSKGNFNKLRIPLPKPDEQIEISNVFMDMDKEIAALEMTLEKYKNVKLGMMQNLLTGKIRLV